MLRKTLWTFVLLSIVGVSLASASLFPFLTCSGGECRFCLASNAGGADKVCSKPYSTNPGSNDPTPGLANISKELTDDLTNKLVKMKEFPKENFEIQEFYEKYAEFSCEQAEQEIQWAERQVEYLQWKIKKINEARSKRSCNQ